LSVSDTDFARVSEDIYKLVKDGTPLPRDAIDKIIHREELRKELEEFE